MSNIAMTPEQAADNLKKLQDETGSVETKEVVPLHSKKVGRGMTSSIWWVTDDDFDPPARE